MEGMADDSKKGGWQIAVTLVLLLLLPIGLYVGGYFATSTLIAIGYGNKDPAYFRYFARSWQSKFYGPAVRVESIVRGCPVKPVSENPDDWRSN